MTEKVILAVVAAVTILEAIALLKGIDGQLLASVLAMLLGTGGFAGGTVFTQWKNRRTDAEDTSRPPQ